uniref:Uncharacterized protein n=1 Tax=Spongospora subterranea TaxID=70186 RepID=A0A0H5R4G4_9EUKA|eukprot:CRZ02944.1 hypothetical protein [Spongospora subterranea]
MQGIQEHSKENVKKRGLNSTASLDDPFVGLAAHLQTITKRLSAVGLFYSRGMDREGKPKGQENTDIYTRVDSGNSSYFYSSAAPSLTLISKRRSTGCRQIGQRFVWNLKTFAHPLHIHMCRHGSTVVSRGSERHITHSFPGSFPSKSLSTELPIPKISCNSYLMPLTQRICFTTLTWYSPLSFPKTA